MNIDNNLILIKGEDKTASVETWRFDRYKSVIFITYFGKNGHLKEYPYNTKEVQYYKNPKIVFPGERIVLKEGSPLSGVARLLIFGQYCRIIYKTNYYELVNTSNLRIVDSALNTPESKKCFEYLRQLAIKTGLVVDGRNILADSYEKLRYVRDDSVLATFLSGKYESERDEKNDVIVYPFGFNLSQKKAVDNALCNKISVIEGPPGTGKTQTILNIIANAVMRGKSVAIVSGNNSATANVLEKLKKYGVDFIAAPLGNSSNRKAFIESQNPHIPDMTSWKIDMGESCDMSRAMYELDSKLSLRNRVSEIKTELEELKNEYTHFQNYYRSVKKTVSKPIFSKYTLASEMLSHMAEYEQQIDNIVRLGIWRRIVWRIKYGVKKSGFIKISPEEYLATCQDEYYQRRIADLESKYKNMSDKLNIFDFEARMKEYAEKSMSLFKAKLEKKYSGIYTRRYYSAEDLYNNSGAFIKDYPVVLSTAYSLRESLSREFMYDYVIIDESSQVDIVTGALALSCAQNAVIVGDLKQLPNVVNKEQKAVTDRVFEEYKLLEAYRYSIHSLLSSVISLFPTVPHVLLKEHYRCHPEIIGFCNQRFYNNDLIILTKSQSDKPPLMVYRTVPGNHARDHMNQRQIKRGVSKSKFEYG